jgi:hypothetical protein
LPPRERHVLYYDRCGPVEGRRDEDGDGIEEFAQALGNRHPRLRLSWDYNGDGRYDSVEYETSGGETVREFSSRLDGVYDPRAVSRAGRSVFVPRQVGNLYVGELE